MQPIESMSDESVDRELAELRGWKVASDLVNGERLFALFHPDGTLFDSHHRSESDAWGYAIPRPTNDPAADCELEEWFVKEYSVVYLEVYWSVPSSCYAVAVHRQAKDTVHAHGQTLKQAKARAILAALREEGVDGSSNG